MSQQSLEDLEPDNGLKKLLDSISCSFEKDRFSMKYKDFNLEDEFFK